MKQGTHPLLTFDSGHYSYHQFVYQQAFPQGEQALKAVAEIFVSERVSYPCVVKMTIQGGVVHQQYLEFPLEEAYTPQVTNFLHQMNQNILRISE